MVFWRTTRAVLCYSPKTRGLWVRAGREQWKLTLDVLPDHFAEAERQKAGLRELLSDVTILRERRQGVAHVLPLSRLLQRDDAAAALSLC